ncbi:MAG: hypothetical protein ABIL09_21615 [Gemmatimonadota bacterium]
MDESTYGHEVGRRALQIAESMAPRGGSMWSAHALLLLEQAGRPLPGAGGRAGERASARILEGLGTPADKPFARVASGTFDLLAAMALVCRWGDELSPAAVDHVRRVFARGILHRGNTENHWLMHYTANLLAAERWPQVEAWWNGLPRAAMVAEARRWILGTIRRTARWGHYEYDSPQYHLCHVQAMLALAEHSADGEVRHLAGQNLTLLIADMALEFYKGAWAGGHSREGYRQNTWTRSGSIPALQFLYFGGEGIDPALHDHHMVGPALGAAYRPPALLAEMAWDRAQPHVVKKTKAPRAVYRHVPADAAPTRKYTYMSPSFALASTQVGLPGAAAGPIDLVSWDLSWEGDKHQAKVVSSHPYRDPRRFAAFLPGMPHTMGRSIATDKPYLQNPDRLFGASPYERMMQWEGTIVVLYRIPPGDANPYVNLYLPTAAAWVETGGWLMADLGSFCLGVRPIGPYTWERIREEDLVDGWLLQIHDCCAGLVLEAAETAVVGSFERFRRARAAARLDLSGWPGPGRVEVADTRGRTLVMEYGADPAALGAHTVDGQPIDYGAYPLYEAPGVEAPLGSGRISLRRSAAGVDLDFGIDGAAPDLPMRVIG